MTLFSSVNLVLHYTLSVEFGADIGRMILSLAEPGFTLYIERCSLSIEHVGEMSLVPDGPLWVTSHSAQINPSQNLSSHTLLDWEKERNWWSISFQKLGVFYTSKQSKGSLNNHLLSHCTKLEIDLDNNWHFSETVVTVNKANVPQSYIFWGKILQQWLQIFFQ